LVTWANGFAEPRFVAGDFNAGPDLQEIAQIGSYVHDSWMEAMNANTAAAYPDNPVQWQTRTRRGRLDYIFFSRGASTVSLRNAQIPDQRDLSRTPSEYIGTSDDRGVRPSDHNFMIATFDLR
jgi:endonuclease/exonuclease/phosphatase family metal-dependent hydrolase